MKGLVSKIISGGQAGADRAALDAAKYLNIRTGGYCPKGYKTETGNDKSLKHFGLKQTQTDNPAERTELNVISSDGTVIFGKIYSIKKISSGTLLTLTKAKEYKKPFLLNPSKKEFNNWLGRYNIKTLNVAGNRLSENSSIYDKVFNFLLDTLEERVLSEFRSALHRINSDNHSGSRTVLNNLISELIKYLENTKSDEKEVFSEIIKETETFAQGKNSEMVTLYNFVKELKREVKANTKAGVLKHIVKKRSEIKNSYKALSLSAINEIQFENKTVLLISNSSSITNLFKELAKRKISVKVIQCKSYPGEEGKIQAAILKSHGYKVKLIEDKDINLYLAKTDFALLGCDAFNKKYFSNKAGSLEIAKTFYNAGKPVYVMADKTKFKAGLNSKHNYSGIFDLIPLSYVTKIIISE